MLKPDELKSLSVDELKEKLGKLKNDLMQYRFQSKTGKLEQQTMVRITKRDIARVLTVMNEKKRKEVTS